MTSPISLRVTPAEKKLMNSYAVFHGVNLSEAIKSAFFEKIEDEFDLQLYQEYEAEKTKGNGKSYTFDEAMKELGLHEDL